jgi:hypothetical protein
MASSIVEKDWRPSVGLRRVPKMLIVELLSIVRRSEGEAAEIANLFLASRPVTLPSVD